MKLRAVLLSVVPFVMVAATKRKRIIGGTVADVRDYPFAVHLKVDIKKQDSENPYDEGDDYYHPDPGLNYYYYDLPVEGTFDCEGTLISPSVILTAASCVFKRFSTLEAKVTAYMGCQNIDHLSECVKKSVKKIHFQGDGAEYEIEKEFALLVINGKFNFDPITLASPGVEIPTGLPLNFLGHGLIESRTYGSLSDDLLQTELFVIDHDQCNDQYARVKAIWEGTGDPSFHNPLPDYQFCASAPGTGPCFYDNGGAAFVKCGNSKVLQVGAFAYGAGCGYPNYPAIFSSVATEEMLDFMSEIVSSLKQEIKTFSGSLNDFCGEEITLQIQPDLELLQHPERWGSSGDSTCLERSFAYVDGCHCDCGIPDPDCLNPNAYVFNCGAEEACIEGVCVDQTETSSPTLHPSQIPAANPVSLPTESPVSMPTESPVSLPTDSSPLTGDGGEDWSRDFAILLIISVVILMILAAHLLWLRCRKSEPEKEALKKEKAENLVMG